MNTFGQMKDLYKLQKEARQMQKKMKKLKIEGLSKDELVKVTLNGLQEVSEIHIADELLSTARKFELIEDLIEAQKDANKKTQKEMMKDMDLDKMKSMLGV